MPLVSIANVPEDDLFHIHRVFFLFGRSDIIPFATLSSSASIPCAITGKVVSSIPSIRNIPVNRLRICFIFLFFFLFLSYFISKKEPSLIYQIDYIVKDECQQE